MESSTLPPTFRITYKKAGDLEIPCDVYLPKVEKEMKCPVVLMVHGGAFILGHSGMVSPDHITDCLSRGWIVVAPEHRLCPHVDIYEGPITDTRDCLAWVYDGGLQKSMDECGKEEAKDVKVNMEKVAAMGMSSGGTCALAMGFSVDRKPAAILDFYGATNFSHPFWSQPLPPTSNFKAPPVPPGFIDKIWDTPVQIKGGVSLEGQASPKQLSPMTDPRLAFAFTHIAKGTIMDVCMPSKDFKKIDAVDNASKEFPPTFIVHGEDDDTVPMFLSEELLKRLKEAGVDAQLVPVPGEKHTFVGKMVKGSPTWDTQMRGWTWLEGIIGRGVPS